jgi:Asp-tRNAAsn/Glu-tRNAGln amidotransferase B subunit (PET112 homolog)
MNLVMIGLEIHAQITALKSKLFCSCYGNYRNLRPNTNICEICSGLPGTLPIINKKAIEYATMTSVALGCKVPDKIMFYRKNYFYPDLPKISR